MKTEEMCNTFLFYVIYNMKEFEYDFWIATDPYGDTYLYDEKPFKDNKWWTGPGTSMKIEVDESVKTSTKSEPKQVSVTIKLK